MGNVLFLTLNKPQKRSIEFNGDRLHNLHLFANELEKEVPLEGYDSICLVQNIRFDTIVINSVRARSLSEAGI